MIKNVYQADSHLEGSLPVVCFEAEGEVVGLCSQVASPLS